VIGADVMAGAVLIVGIVFGGSYAIVRSVMTSEIKRLELHKQIKQAAKPVEEERLKAVETELASLRETSTQFDVSLQNAVERIDHRLEHVENKAKVGSETQAEPLTQRVGGR
jgi:hypothetical protein